MRARSTAAGAVLLAVALVASGCSSGSGSSSTASASGSKTSSAVTDTAVGTRASKPNIVFILTDDLSWNLINKQFAPHIVQLQQQGASFDHYFVADSLCCPSRSTMFTGLFPHDTKVLTNKPPDGGFEKFQEQGLDQKTWAVSLHDAGYQTSMLGKYLNGYGDPMNAEKAPVPPGWTDWHVSNSSGYAEYNFLLNDNGKVNSYKGQQNYGVDVANRDVQSFIHSSGAKPFIVEAATFAPHAPYTPATRNANDFPGLTEPRDPSFNAAVTNPPSWLGTRPVLGPKKVAKIDQSFRKRAQAVEAVDKLLADTEATLAKEHLTDKTYIVFTSDNGYHLGQHRLQQGKQTAYDTDINVPLIVAGPGIAHGQVLHQVAQNVDLAPTFTDLTGAEPVATMDGHSLTPLLFGSKQDQPWRTLALVEHKGTNDPTDPDSEGGGSDPTSYNAIRISAKSMPGFSGPVEGVYVEYDNAKHELEYYDIKKDPYELDNIAGTLTDAQKTGLHEALAGLTACHTADACWTAAKPG